MDQNELQSAMGFSQKGRPKKSRKFHGVSMVGSA